MLLTKENRKNLPALYETEGVDTAEKNVVVKFFTPWSNWTWYAVEGAPVLDEEGNEVDFEFFGLVDGHCKEWGYFMLSELAKVKGPFGLKVERDMHFTNVKMSEVLKN